MVCREESDQFFAHQINGPYQPFSEFVLFKIFSKKEAYFVPKTGGHFLMDALVPQNGKSMGLGAQKEKHAITVFGIGHSQIFKSGFGGQHDIA